MTKKLTLTHAQEITIVTAMLLIGLAIAGYYAFILAKLSREGPRPEQVAAAEQRAARHAAARHAAPRHGYVTLAEGPAGV